MGHDKDRLVPLENRGQTKTTATAGGSMVGSDRLNVPAIDNSSH